MSKEVSKYEQDLTTTNIIGDTIQALVEGITGIASSKREDVALSVGRLVQRLRAGQRLSAFLEEWNLLREKGRIKDDYQYSEQHRNCLHELLDFLDKDIPDEARFNAIKNILLVAATEDVESRESVLPHQYIKICKRLSSGAILVLIATYYKAGAMTHKTVPRDENANMWLSQVAERAGLKHPELVGLAEKELVDTNLLLARQVGDRSVILREKDRLTDLGYGLCVFFDHYDVSKK